MAIDNELAFVAARQIEVVNQRVARVVIVSVPLAVNAGAAIAAIPVVVFARIVPSSVRHGPSCEHSSRRLGLSVKTPWLCLRGAVQRSAEALGRVAAALDDEPGFPARFH